MFSWVYFRNKTSLSFYYFIRQSFSFDQRFIFQVSIFSIDFHVILWLLSVFITFMFKVFTYKFSFNLQSSFWLFTRVMLIFPIIVFSALIYISIIFTFLMTTYIQSIISQHITNQFITICLVFIYLQFLVLRRWKYCLIQI